MALALVRRTKAGQRSSKHSQEWLSRDLVILHHYPLNNKFKMSISGTSQPSLGPNDSYKDVARKTLWNRYNDQGE